MNDTVTDYLVSWQEWQGIEPCGKTDWAHRVERCAKLDKAMTLFADMKRQHSYVKLRRITNELLDQSDD
jgi:hypothetical protein